jgi:LCP family protein required for cell wall assembly
LQVTSSVTDRGSPGGVERAPADTYWSGGREQREGLLRRHPVVRIVAIVLLLAVVAVVAFTAGSMLGYLSNTLGSLQTHDRPTVTAAKRHLAAAAPDAPVTFLFLGSDRRQPHGPGHVDSILLLRLDPASHRMALLFIPRDLLARVPGHGTQPIAAAYRLGGAVLTLVTVERLTGVPINHFLDVDFQGFIDIVNTLGGVRTTVPAGLGTPPGPSWASAPLRPGYDLLNGRELLSYVRLKEDAYGGEGWLAGQGAILAQLRSRLATQVDWTDPLGALRLLKEATRNTVSDVSGVRSWYDLARQLVASRNGHISQTRLTGRTVKSGDTVTVIASPAHVRQAVQAFLSTA